VKRLLLLAVALFVSACGSSSTAPTPASTTPTKIITVSGNLAFGDVPIGTTVDRSFTIGNSGNALLTWTGFNCTGGTGTTGYTASPLTGTVSPGQSVSVTVRFTPTVAQFYSCVLSVVGDQTSGGAAINVTGTGINNNPIFTLSGKGDNVFNLPSYVARVHVTGHFVDNGGNSNFIVDLNGRNIINAILRSVDYDGVLLTTGGGVITITNSSAINWTFTEVR
jgi:hypothetical protein